MSIETLMETMGYGPAPEARDQADAWLARHAGGFGLYIGGSWVAPRDGGSFEVASPATGETIATAALAGGADVDAAVSAAAKAAPGWAALPGHARARYLYALARLVQKHARLLAVVESLDNGKPVRETRDIDVPLVARHFYHHAGWAQILDAEFPGHEPLGVVGQIIPWNFPLLMASWKIAPALAAGNTVVLKPAEYTPLTALLFAEIAEEAGLPAGVLNIVTGEGATGAALAAHQGIAKVAFTGSTEVGRLIRKATAGQSKRLTLELGGKSPFIVFDDADLDSAVEGVVDAIWFNQGQVCCAGSRLLMAEGIETRMIAKLKARMEHLRVGDPLDKAIDIGAIVHPIQRDRIEALVQKGGAEGCEIWQPSGGIPKTGCYYPPTLLTGVTPSSTVAQVEIFGPVLAAMSFRTPTEAVQIANNTVYGLAASVWTESINLALDIAPKLKAGVVWVNCTNQLDAAAGFGGVRSSGFGREGGREGMAEYLRPAFEAALKPREALPALPEAKPPAPGSGLPAVDRTAKMYIGGKQARPDSGYSQAVPAPDGTVLAEVGTGNRKDIRNAVEAAVKAESWSRTTGHLKAQILYYVAENLAARAGEFASRLRAMTGAGAKAAAAEVEASVSRLFTYAAYADKYDGQVHSPPMRGVALAMNEPIGVMGIVCPDEAPLLALVSLVAPAVAAGNRVVVVPSERHPLSATDFYQVLDTSDVPGGVVNIVTGTREPLAKTLAEHDGVDALWYWGPREGCAGLEAASAGNLKRVWTGQGLQRDWRDTAQAEGREFLRAATEVKNIWVPYGE
ncbi:Aldehyde dehydrogenase [hydrothermal vent metagenome]|uniref:Aldehyde dehydrogenase n=1 Tax=hydrothermal vent metagenome TaxID=652676 RepID=A0A3B0TL45_9ZZZZ